jgi:hypothetical protein
VTGALKQAAGLCNASCQSIITLGARGISGKFLKKTQQQSFCHHPSEKFSEKLLPLFSHKERNGKRTSNSLVWHFPISST